MFQTMDAGDGGVAGSPVRGIFRELPRRQKKNFAKPVPRYSQVWRIAARTAEGDAQSFTPPIEPSGQAKSANTGA